MHCSPSLRNKKIYIALPATFAERAKLLFVHKIEKARRTDGVEDKLLSVSVIFENISVALSANDQLITSLTMSGKLHISFIHCK